MRRMLAGFLLLLALAAAAPAQQAKEDMIYPRGTAPAERDGAAPGARAGSGSPYLLGAAALAAAAGWWLWQKRRESMRGAPGTRLAIVETKSLGSRQYLVVADYDGRKFLLGVCPGRIELLTPLDGSGPSSR